MDEKERVREHLSLLSILHYVYAGLLALGSCVGCFYAGIGQVIAQAVREHPPAGQSDAHAAEMVGNVFTAIGAGVTFLLLAGAVCTVLSGYWMGKKKNRTFSIVIAGISCVSVPLGTLLGVFTLIALMKPEAIELYAESERGAI